MITVDIIEDGKKIGGVEAKEKALKTGSHGYYGNTVVVIKGKAVRCNFLLIEIANKK